MDFSDVDGVRQPQELLDYLEQVEVLAPMAAARESTYRAIPDGTGVDVGCGWGRAVADLATRGRKAVGVDRSRTLVTSARRRFPSCAFAVGDAAQLPFADGVLDWYRAERVYQHLADPLSALAEAGRVLSPGGTIVSADQDFDSAVLPTADTAMTRVILTALTDSLYNGRVGSRMPQLLAEAGFTGIQVTALPLVSTDLAPVVPIFIQPALAAALEAGQISAREAVAWQSELEDRDRSGVFLVAVTMFITTALRAGSGANPPGLPSGAGVRVLQTPTT